MGDIHPKVSLPQVLAEIDCLMFSGKDTAELQCLRKDGSVFDISINMSVIDIDGCKFLLGIFADITARKQMVLALSESNELLSRYIRDSPIYSFIKTVTPTESRVLLASENFHELVGIPGSEMQGKTMAELFPAEFAAKMTTDDWNVVSSGKTVRLTEEFNGRHYSTIKFPVVQGSRTLVAGYTIDITEQTLAEQTMRQWNQNLDLMVSTRTEELKQSETRFRQMADAAFEGIAVIEEGILMDGNKQLGDMLGYKLDEMLGHPVTDFVAPESRELVARSIRDGVETPYEHFAMRKDGSKFPAEVNGRMGVWNGKSMRVSVFRDLSLIKQNAARFRAQQIELDHALRLSLLSEISAGIIHQIGQPLNAIGLFASVASRNMRSCQGVNCGNVPVIKQLEELVGITRDTVTQMQALIRPESDFTHVPIDVNDWVEDIMRMLHVEAETRGAVMEVKLSRKPLQVMANAAQLTQVILILVRNAFDACAECPPERRNVVIATRAKGDSHVEVCVRDTGPGIAPDAMTRLFEPFFTTKAGGMGIGLRLSRTIVHAHGGKIKGGNNANGVGATFCVVLPRYRAG